MTEIVDGTFHGGFVRDRGEGRGVRVSTVKAQDLSPVTDPQMAQERALAVSMGSGSQELKSLTGGLQNPVAGRKPKLAVCTISKDILDKGNPAYARCVRLANGYKKVRTKEIYAAHGFVSAGVSAMLASASLAMAASRFLYETAASAEMFPERGAVGASGLAKLASSLSDSARQNELAAWELAAKEAKIKERNDSAKLAQPWLVPVGSSPVGTDTPSLTSPTERTGKRGRPKKIVQVIESNG